MKWKNLKLSSKFSIAFGLIIVLIIINGFKSITGIDNIISNAKEVIDGNELRTNIEEKHVQHLNWVLKLNDYIHSEEKKELDIQTDHHKCAFGQWYYGEGRKELETSVPELTAVLAKLEDPHQHLHASAINIEEVLTECNHDHIGVMKAEKIYNDKTIQELNEISALFKQLQNDSKRHIMTDQVMLHEATNTNNTILIIGIFAVVIGVILSIIITKGLLKPINKAVSFTNEFAKGNLTADIEINQKDEIGQLAFALTAMKTKLIAIINDIIEGSNIIAVASEQLSSSSSEQAASAEEVSSSMEEMMANIEQNSENSIQTERIANNAAIEIETGYNSVTDTVKSMKNIAENISVIEEIAEKTDLLAINAAIEAARAGEHGKGFAVVAMEVRKLAERSQQAAAEINSISKSSVILAEDTGNKMGDIVPEIKKTSTLVQEITAGSREQKSGGEQVNNAIQSLNQVNQNNAASAEELANQAVRLKETIEFFNVGKTTHKKTTPLQTSKPNGKHNGSKILLDEFTEAMPESENEFETY